MTPVGTTIVIVGGGFSGTVTAVHLLRQARDTGCRVVLINRSGAMARGIAYGTTSEHHVLNVPAARMSAFDDDPDSFVRFVRDCGQPIEGGAFVSRHLYGAYLESLLRQAGEQAPPGALERLQDEVRHLEPAADGTHALLTLHSGAQLRADRVVLALGNYPPQAPDVPEAAFFCDSPRFVADPWRPGALDGVSPDRPTLLIGTGLTMIDIVLELRAKGRLGGGPGRCIAMSRRGLLPQPHRVATRPPDPIEVPAELIDGPVTARAFLRVVRQHTRALRARDIDWRDLVGSLREITPALWQAMPPAEQRRFLRHVRPFWEVHRHRVAPSAHATFVQLQQAGQIDILAARLLSAREHGDGVAVQVRPRGSERIVTLNVGSVINCTGPAGDTRRLQDPLLDDLRARGLLTPDALGLGLQISASGEVIAADGHLAPTLYYVGPFARARDWEATAVPELRRLARELAMTLIDSFTRSREVLRTTADSL
jgi:uncharacterized NAD(P)/FAD-binding protein YdhS